MVSSHIWNLFIKVKMSNETNCNGKKKRERDRTKEAFTMSDRETA